jgi:hypothetical protein
MSAVDLKRTLVDQAGSLRSIQGIRGYSHRCHLPDSGESLSALWIARYLTAGMSANESLESLGALWAQQRSEEDNYPHLDCGIKTFHVMERGSEDY